MLAMEAYEKLSALVGEGNVGLLTGEEQVNPGAPLICATAEMAPMSGKVLVVDEVQWVADRDRGWAWTRLLAGSDYEEVHLCGAPEAEALLRRAYSDAGHFELVAHERLEALELKGAVTLKQVPDNSVVVAFSRKAVLALARQLGRDGRRAAVLYGALPPVARRAELERFISGEASVMVATDVIGHGVNMPAKAVVMAETTKYDGFGRRPLEVWEAAQIVGRAGRHGLAGAGSVHVLTGVTGFTADPQLVRRAVEATTGLRAARPDLTTGELRPTLGDLGVEHPGDFLVALDAWFAKARRALADHPWLRPLDVTSLLERAGVLEECFADAGLEWPITADEAWSLLRMPVDHTRKDSLFELLVLAVGGEPSPLQGLLERARKRLPSGTQEDLEVAAGQFRDLRAFATSFPENAVITAEEARLLEEEAGTLLVKRMDKAVSANSYGVCSGCGKPCAPWFTSCQSCHQGSYRGYGRGHRESWYDEFDD
jgi:ATP-dependent RNA helicase SUPV3L1/SUV3